MLWLWSSCSCSSCSNSCCCSGGCRWSSSRSWEGKKELEQLGIHCCSRCSCSCSLDGGTVQKIRNTDWQKHNRVLRIFTVVLVGVRVRARFWLSNSFKQKIHKSHSHIWHYPHYTITITVTVSTYKNTCVDTENENVSLTGWARGGIRRHPSTNSSFSMVTVIRPVERKIVTDLIRWTVFPKYQLKLYFITLPGQIQKQKTHNYPQAFRTSAVCFTDGRGSCCSVALNV